MPIRFNPGCPCCWVVSIAGGLYCTRWKCVEKVAPYDPNTKYYVSENEVYFPPQTITLYRLGTGNSYSTFEPDEKEIASAKIEQEVVLKGDFGPPVIYMGNDWVDDDGKLKIKEIEDTMNIGNGGGSPVKSLNGWPPLFLFSRQEVVANTWYKLVFDVGKFGKVEKIFFVTGGDYIAYHYYLLTPENFPVQRQPQDPPTNQSQPIKYQNLEYRCCSPCIIKYKDDIIVQVEYTEIDTGNYGYDHCWGCCYYWWYYPYVTYEDCQEEAEKHPYGHTNVEWTNVKTSISVNCKWNGLYWVSDPVDLYSEKITTEWFEPWCTPNDNYSCKCVSSQDYTVSVTVTCSDYNGCDDKGNVLAYNVSGNVKVKNHVSNDNCWLGPWWWDGCSRSEYCCPWWCCNLSGNCCGKSYGFFYTTIIEPQCEQLSGTIFYKGDDKGCTAGIKGDVKGG